MKLRDAATEPPLGWMKLAAISMANPGTFEALKSAKTIGSANLAAWSTGFNPNEYLNVLPNADIKLIMNDGWSQWQK